MVVILGIAGIEEDVTVMQIVVPKVWIASSFVSRENCIDDVLVLAEHSELLFGIWLIELGATEQSYLFQRFQSLSCFHLPLTDRSQVLAQRGPYKKVRNGTKLF
jgi:hypothetical protein